MKRNRKMDKIKFAQLVAFCSSRHGEYSREDVRRIDELTQPEPTIASILPVRCDDGMLHELDESNAGRSKDRSD